MKCIWKYFIEMQLKNIGEYTLCEKRMVDKNSFQYQEFKKEVLNTTSSFFISLIFPVVYFKYTMEKINFWFS